MNIATRLPPLYVAAAMTQYQAGYIDTNGQIAISSATVKPEGWMARAADPAATEEMDKRGTFIPFAGSSCASGIAASAIAAGAVVYAAASGRVDDAGTIALGKALTAATAAGQKIDYLVNIPHFNPAAFAAA